MKKIDWYIIRKFLGAFFFTTLLFIAVAVVVDLSENVDDFLEFNVPLKDVVFGYYFNMIPKLVLMLSPLFIFIAVIFFTSRLASRSELVAILSSGVSFYRLLFVPYLFSAVFLFGLQYAANHYLVPKTNWKLVQYKDTYSRNKLDKKQRNIYMQISNDSYLTLKSYEPKDSLGKTAILETLKEGVLVEKLKGETMEWNTETQDWTWKNYVLRTIDGDKENIETGDTINREITISPADFNRTDWTKDALTTPELNKVIEREKMKGGNNLAFLLIEKYNRTSTPFATIILTFIGFAIASRKTRGGMGLHILLGVGISSLYVLMMQFSTTFATNADFSPFLAVWLPNLIFLIVSFVLVYMAPK